MSASTRAESVAPRLVRIAGRDTYYIRHNGRRHSTGEAQRTAAEAVLAEYIADQQRPALGSAVCVSDILDLYLADRVRREKPGAERLSWAHKALNRHLGTSLPGTVNEGVCVAYGRARAAEGVRPSTVRTELQALGAALRWAAVPHQAIAGGEALIERVPTMELPPKPPARERWLTRAEADLLLAACRSAHIKLFIQIALNTASRRTAVLTLTWDRVDLERRIIDFRDSEAAETKKRRTRVRINDTLLAILTQAKARAETAYVIERAGVPVASVKHGFHDAAERAGLADVTPHVLRHTAVTWMMQAGVDRWEICGMAKITLQVLEDVYGHHHPDYQANAATALG